ncbi:hypothetical protein PGQ11_001724 [Apiospora arundinis]|uniref:Uncharacterized protein n=1 Tax=Apiospora arundinis TaxID=335852 RepID=A0ABR2JFV1_9PEZI
MSDRDSDGLPPIADISYDDDRDGPVSLPHIFDITEGIDETESIEETNSNEEAYDSETYEDSADNEESEDDEETLPTRPPMQMWDDFPTTLGNPPPYTGPLINRPLGPKHRFFDRNLPELMIPKLDEIYDSVEYDYYEESEGYKEPERSSVDAPINWAERKVERILSLLAIYEADDPELNEINAYEHREQLQAIENLPLDDLIEAPLSPHSEASEFGDATQIDDF